jgi:ceramide glucosyltransferase
MITAMAASAAAFWRVLLAIAWIGTLSSTAFLLLTIVAAVRYWLRARAARNSARAVPESSLPPVTLLKPVHGDEPRLRQNLESFFRQDYPNFEIVFGARSADDPALRVADEIRQRYPQVKCRTVLSGTPAWPNAKVFSLDKMIAETSRDYLIISDSDVEAGPDFLRNIVPPLLNSKAGLVTCLCEGVPARGLWSLLEAMGMSIELSSGVLVADMMEGMRFGLGAVLATRRDALEKIGGIAACANYYSDDFVLGNLISEAGREVVLSHYIVGHVLIPHSFVRTFGHQVRWMKSTRYSRPKGHLGTGLTFAVPFGLLGFISAAALGHMTMAVGLLLASLFNRVIQSLAVGWGIARDPRSLIYCWLYPLRDLFGFCTWVGSYTSSTFLWRDEIYRFSKQGRIIPQTRSAQSPAQSR